MKPWVFSLGMTSFILHVRFFQNHLKWTSHQQHGPGIYLPGFTVVDFYGIFHVSKYTIPDIPWMLWVDSTTISSVGFSIHPYLNGETSNICYFSPGSLGGNHPI